MSRKVVHPGSAIGEAIGNLIEENIREAVRAISEPLGYKVASQKLRNGMGNVHQIDTVIENQHGDPVILIEPKYLRYKKHNWDKGSRLCIGHYSLRKTFKTIQKSIAVLAGNWTRNSMNFIQSFGIEIYEIPFLKIVGILGTYGIPFAWEEKDARTPRKAWEKFKRLKKDERNDISRKLTEEIIENVTSSVKRTLTLDPSVPKQIVEIETLIKTTQNEFIVQGFKTVTDAIKYLLSFQADVSDLKGVLK